MSPNVSPDEVHDETPSRRLTRVIPATDWKSDGQPIASGTWTPATDAASQDNWDVEVGRAINKTNIIQAGNSNSAPPTWGAAELIATENSTVKQYVATYAHHNYPGGTVQSLMSHSGIVSNMQPFVADVAAAVGVGKPYVFGETNSGRNFPCANQPARACTLFVRS